MDSPASNSGPASESLFAVFRRRWWLLALCVVVGAGAAGLISSRQQKQYQASAKLLFRTDSSPDLSLQSAFGEPPTASAIDPTQQAATNVGLVSLGQVANMTAGALGHRVSASTVTNEVSVSQVGQSAIVTITATDPSPVFAATLADTFARQFIVFRANIDRALFTSAAQSVSNQLAGLAPAVRNGPAGRAMQARLLSLQTLASMQDGNAQLVQTATIPTAAAVPRTKLDIAAGAGLGLLLGFVLALLFHRGDRRMKTPDELADAYALPLLGVVPQTAELSRKRGRDGHGADAPLPVAGAAADAFRALRTRLWYASRRRELQLLLVTSATRGEGKSTTAWQLARAIAATGEGRVLLLEADLRHPAIAGRHGLEAFPGLADVLRGQASLDSVVQRVSISRATDLESDSEIPRPSLEHVLDLDGEAVATDAGLGTPASPGESDAYQDGSPGATATASMDVIVAGVIPPDPSDLLDSGAMSELLDTLSSRYDCVILDAPPAPVVTDTLPLIKRVSGVLVVSSVRHASREAADRLRWELEQLKAPLLGVVVNRAKTAWNYYYGSDKADRVQAERQFG